MAKLGVVLGALALAGVALLHLRVGELEDLVRAGTRAPRERLIHTTEERNAPTPRDTAAAAAAVGVPVTLEERIRRLEETVKKTVQVSVPQYFPQDVDGFARTFKLSSTQKVRVRDIVERARRRIDDLMTTPGADGKTPKQLIEEQNEKTRKAIESSKGGGRYTVSLGFADWHTRKLAGRKVTYGDELKRIRDEGREELERELTEDQRKTFSNTDTSVLLGGAEPAGISYGFTGIEVLPPR